MESTADVQNALFGVDIEDEEEEVGDVDMEEEEGVKEEKKEKKEEEEEEGVEEEKDDGRFYCPVEGCNIHPPGYSHKQKLNNHLHKHHKDIAVAQIEADKISFTNGIKHQVNNYFQHLKQCFLNNSFPDALQLPSAQRGMDQKLLDDVKKLEEKEGVPTTLSLHQQEIKQDDEHR